MNNENEITFFAKTNFRNQERIFGIKTDDRRRHMYVIGKTGMGKTNMLENMVVQDIRNGHGVCYIDPHGDTAEKLIKSIPSSRINDVIYFNPADQNFPIAFNVMESVDPEYRHLVASGLVGVFKKIWADSWGPRLEYILRNAILALLEYPGSTLLGVTRILVDKKYRERVVEKVTDPVVKMFWVDEFTKWNERVLQEVVSPIQNKVGQFLSTSLIRNIVGQTQSTFDVRKIMDERKILILNLSKGRIGEDASALMGAMMITKIQLAAMGRVDIAEDERKDFYLYVDEFQNFATLSFANILSEARKYHLNLILANQYVTQIEEDVRDAIFGNAGTIISFRVGAVDAEFLEKEFEPVFMQNDIVNLAKYNIYLKLMIDGIAGDAFSAVTLPPVLLGETEQNEEKVVAISRERYTASKEEVEDKISRWSGMIPSGVISKESPGKVIHISRPSENTQFISKTASAEKIIPTQPKQILDAEENFIASQPEKILFDAKCDTCDVAIRIPFKPDGKRPTFCKDCLKDYQRAVAKAKERDESAKAELSSSQTPSLPKKEYTKPREEEPRRTVSAKTYSSTEKPLTLFQMQHISPKKFKQTREKAQVDLNGLRQAMGKIKNNSSQ